MIQQESTPAIDAVVAEIGSRLDSSPFAVLLDVDGTLAPIAPTPGAARIPDDTREVLRMLARLSGVTIVFVSGRSADDAWRLTGVDGAWVVGNHGVELRAPSGEIIVDERVAAFERAIADAAQSLGDLVRTEPGVIVENKRWTLSLHYRLVAVARREHVLELGREVARTFGLRTREAKKTLELRPPVSVDKGTAVLAFAERIGVGKASGSALYAGDDTTDEDAFRALRQNTNAAVTLRIKGPDDGNATSTAAEFVLGSTEELRELLRWIALRRSRAQV